MCVARESQREPFAQRILRFGRAVYQKDAEVGGNRLLTK
jgi:hypothetical protein